MTTARKQRWCNHDKYPQYVFYEHPVGLANDYEYAVYYRCTNCELPRSEYTIDRASLYKKLLEPRWKPNNKPWARLFYCLVPAIGIGAFLSLLSPVIGLIFGISVFWLGMSVTE